MTTPEASRAQNAARVALAAALVALGVWTLWEFIPALVWAGIIAIGIWPLYAYARQRCPGDRHNLLLPTAFTLIVALVFIAPLVIAAVRVARDWHAIVEWLQSAHQSGIPAPAFLTQLPFGAVQVVAWWNENLADPDAAAELLRRVDRSDLVGVSRQIGAMVVHRAILFGFSLTALFFLFRDGDRLAMQMLRASNRAFGHSGEEVSLQIVASVHGTVNGLVLVGLAEGLLLGITYALTGVPHPAMFGAITAVAAMIPLGAPIIFGIAALTLVGQGSTVPVIIVLATGVIVTFVADHVVRPVLIGGATKLPFLWVLFGILGGVASWGLLGLFLGPAVMAALISLWREWVGGDGT